MTGFVFVYGTLLSATDHEMGRRLRAEADLVGPATIAGKLYRVSWYPGLVDEMGNDIVRGEVYALHSPAKTLVWLDEFEGVSRGSMSVTEQDRYAREVRTVTVSDDQVDAWVYLYRGPLDGLAHVPDGDWTAAGRGLAT